MYKANFSSENVGRDCRCCEVLSFPLSCRLQYSQRVNGHRTCCYKCGKSAVRYLIHLINEANRLWTREETASLRGYGR